MFFKLLRYDIRVGILQKYKCFFITLVLFICACIEHQVRLSFYQGLDSPYPLSDTLGNTLFSILGGVQEYDSVLDKQFTFPVIWLMLYLMPAYFTLHYPQRDLEESGQNLLIRTRGRDLWWISKCLWNMAMVFVFWGIGVLTVAFFCILRNVPLSMEISGNMSYFLELRSSQLLLYPKEMSLELLLLPFLVSGAFCLLQMTVSLFIRPIFSFMVTGSLLLVSAYDQSPYILGNYAMPVRSGRMWQDGVDPVRGILFSVGVMVFSFGAGLVRFRYYDILKRE